MRAVQPISRGFVERAGVRLGYEVFGEGDPTILLLPTWTIIHSRFWKMQVPYFAQHGFRVVVYDPRGNGRSDRPATGYGGDSFYDDMLAVCDATGVERATFVGLSAGAHPAIRLAVEQPHRVSHLILIGPSVRFGEHTTAVSLEAFLAEPRGQIHFADHVERPVRAVPTRSARLREAVSAALAAKYDTKASRKWVEGFAEPERMQHTLELVPR